ncbi:MAG TPA: FUSC family protein [Stellaceae bacterium]|nr:FUSC family protein [Stellaceae bacterium]
MRALLNRLRKLLASGPNRIALSTALRGTMATAVPLVVLPHIGLGAIAYPAVLGALATSMVDVGGPYRTRFVGMLIQALGGPSLLLLGSVAGEEWWLAALVMAAIGIVSGLIRALGPGGASLGINTAVAFLVGLQVGASGAPSAPWAGGYGAGGLLTIVVALSFWQLRPYRRLEQEAAGAWEGVAALVVAIAVAEDGSVVARRRREQGIAAAHDAARNAVEQARASIGAMRAGTAGPGRTMAQLVVLLNAAARIGAAVVALSEVAPVPDRPAAMAELVAACRAVAKALLDGKGDLPLADFRRRFETARAAAGTAQDRADLLAWAQALRHLDNAEEALRLLFEGRQRSWELLQLPFAHGLPKGAVIGALRTHLTPRSAVFRHAVRVAGVTALETAMLAYFRLPRGIWLPMTSLIVMQPEYGATVRRALERTFGTIIGAALAGVLLTSVHGTAFYDAAIGLLLFLTFLLIRRRYSYGITCLTPLIILLIGMSSADPWFDLAERLAYTVAGALLALAAGYLLWPAWEREQLRDRLAAAIGAVGAYLDAALSAMAAPDPEAETNIRALRRQAEIAVANADAGFQRMLAEPARKTPLIAAGFALLVYLHRLCRHTIALAAQLGTVAAPPELRGDLQRLLMAALDDAAEALRQARSPAARPAFDAPLAELASACGGAVAPLLGRLVSDTTSLLGATAAAAGRASQV